MTSSNSLPGAQITAAIRRAHAKGSPALVAYLTAGYPTKARFTEDLRAVAAGADVVEIGVPFTDPMADGVTIQRASRAALAQGVSLRWILDELSAMRLSVPVILMSYMNPLLAVGLEQLCRTAVEANVAGFIVPDLPVDESDAFRAALDPHALALIQMVTPVTSAARLARLCDTSQGFVYAVTMTGTTGRSVAVPQTVLDYLDRVRAQARIPVCAGFGIRSREQVALLADHVDGVIVGSALVEVLERNEDPAAWLATLRADAR
jgi:tryptophan synthase alpha chain